MTKAPDRKSAGTFHLDVARAAAKLFLEKGFTSASGADIAAAVGVSERTVWRHFLRLCAVASMGAVRTVDEAISVAALRHKQTFTLPEIVMQMSRAIRAVSNLPFCDPVALKPFGSQS